ncbi:MAG: ribosome maturation factor RimP [Acidimicrobiales bacterium]|nr:ribosome maturation factor RimP [Acidimicrobiales bacterium]
MDTAGRARELVAPLVADVGASLYDIDFNGGVLRVTVEREGGVSLDVIAKLTRAISHALDEADPIAGHYTLEVSSPGLERTLRRPEHFAGAVGSLVSLKLRAGAEGDRRVRGTLVTADDDAIVVEVDGEPRTVALDRIERARTVFEWGPAAKPGARSSSPSQKKKAARS